MLLCPWNSLGKDTALGSCSLLQGICPMQGSNPGLLHCRKILYHLFIAGRLFTTNFSSVQLLSRVWLFVTPWTVACQASLSITNSWSLLKLISTESMMPSNHLILYHPLLLPPSIFPSISISIFKWVNSSHQVAKVLEFQLQHQSFQWIFRTDFL